MHTRERAARLSLLAVIVVAAVAALALLQFGLARAEPGAGEIIIQPESPMAQKGPPGAVISYTVRITNNTGAGDIFTITVAGHHWPTQILLDGTQTMYLPLGPNASRDLVIEVTIPANAGGHDIATLIVTSNNTPAVSATVMLVTAVEYRLHLPATFARP